MSRFSDYDDYEGEPEQILAMGRWQRNARAVLKSKRGRKALAELREALMALPEHRLIDGALCTVGAEKRRADLAAEAEAHHQRWAQSRAKYLAEHPEQARFYPDPVPGPDTEMTEGLDKHVQENGEGVCGVGAYAWYQKVKAGMDPAEAFASLPLLADWDPDGHDLRQTAELGEDAGLTFTLAWELAYKNDETFGSCTPEERWQKFVDWIDAELGAVPA